MGADTGEDTGPGSGTDPGDGASAGIRVSVIIAVRNGAWCIGEQLDALAAQPVDPALVESWEVVVADNGSTDDTRSVIEARMASFPELRLIDASGERGASFARNRAVDAATGTHVAIVDADDVVSDGWLNGMARELGTHPVVAGCLEYSRLNEGLAATQSAIVGLFENPGFLPHAGSGNLAMDIDIYRALGGFDERFLNAGNDVDLSWRIQLAGHVIWFAPDVVVHVRERVSLRASFRQFLAYGMQEPRLHRMYRDRGRERPPAPRSLVRFLRMALTAPSAWKEPDTRLSWVKRLGFRIGCVMGSIKYRTWYLS